MRQSAKRLKIDLDEITSSYEVGLIDKLRHFGLEAEFLETWVPDPDPVKSVINLVDAAVEGSVADVIDLKFSGTLIRDESLDNLVDQLKATLTVGLDRDREGITLSLSGFDKRPSVAGNSISLQVTKSNVESLEESPPVVRLIDQGADPLPSNEHKLSNRIYDLPKTTSISNMGRLEPEGEGSLIQVQQNGINFQLKVQLSNHQIQRVAFNGSIPEDLVFLLDRFCDVVKSLPILEAANHGVARLEQQLRGENSKPPVSGIVLPTAVDHRFKVLQDLIRSAFSEYRQISNYQEINSDFDSGPSESWYLSSREQRMSKLEESCDSVLGIMGLNPDEFELIDIEHDVRVLVRFRGSLADLQTDKQSILMRVEKELTKSVDSRLELYLEPVQDESTLRRLTIDT